METKSLEQRQTLSQSQQIWVSVPCLGDGKLATAPQEAKWFIRGKERKDPSDSNDDSIDDGVDIGHNNDSNYRDGDGADVDNGHIDDDDDGDGGDGDGNDGNDNGHDDDSDYSDGDDGGKGDDVDWWQLWRW